MRVFCYNRKIVPTHQISQGGHMATKNKDGVLTGSQTKSQPIIVYGCLPAQIPQKNNIRVLINHKELPPDHEVVLVAQKGN